MSRKVNNSIQLSPKGEVNSGGYPRIFQVKGADQNARKSLSTGLVNTKVNYFVR